jgi:hypothetical protein
MKEFGVLNPVFNIACPSEGGNYVIISFIITGKRLNVMSFIEVNVHVFHLKIIARRSAAPRLKRCFFTIGSLTIMKDLQT